VSHESGCGRSELKHWPRRLEGQIGIDNTMIQMPAGDAQKVWFPEMIETLRSEWHHGMSFEATIELRDALDAMLQRIRSERHIRSPVFKCPLCGHVGEGAQPHVSVRAMFLSLLRFGIADAEQIKTFEKRWALYRQQNNLDVFGKREGTYSAKMPRCGHPLVR
jgi:hypothetical protein